MYIHHPAWDLETPHAYCMCDHDVVLIDVLLSTRAGSHERLVSAPDPNHPSADRFQYAGVGLGLGPRLMNVLHAAVALS